MDTLTFGKLTVIEVLDGRYRLCRCECGNVKRIRIDHLESGATTSCGCGRIKHGLCGKRIYKIWQDMIERCYNPNHEGYQNYGGRGIAVCAAWRESAGNLLRDMGEPPAGMTLDRYPNKDGNYEPGNCRWATQREQCRNMRNNHSLTHNGQTKTIAEWSEITGIGWSTIKERVRRGWPIDRILTEPIHRITEQPV